MRLTRESNLLKLDTNLLKTSNKNKNLRKNQMKKIIVSLVAMVLF